MDHPLSVSPHGSSPTLDRRRLLRTSALLSGTAAAVATAPLRVLAAGVPPDRASAWLALLAPSTPEALAAYTPVALTGAVLATLRAAVDRLIPADDEGPGAVDVGAHVFIDRALAGPNAATLPVYQAGLAALDQAAGAGGFAALAAAEQDDLLTQAEANDLGDVPDGFFALLLEHTRQGMFSDPIYGGNLDYVGWDLVGYAGIKLVWTSEDQAINADVAPEHTSIEAFGGAPS